MFVRPEKTHPVFSVSFARGSCIPHCNDCGKPARFDERTGTFKHMRPPKK